VGHGRLLGYAERSSERVRRGLRLFCSNRHRRRGCGRTVAIWLATFLPRRVVGARTLLSLVVAIAAGQRLATAWRALSSMAVRTGYRLRDRLALAGPAIRTALLARAPPPQADRASPHAQLLEHLRAALGEAADFATYQLTFQRSVLG